MPDSISSISDNVQRSHISAPDSFSDFSSLKGKRIGYALCGSFCTFQKTFEQARRLTELGAVLTPILSYHAATLDTRFGKAEEHRKTLENICGRPVLDSIQATEPIGPKALLDLLIVAPCTGNTLAKLATSITDTPVTMAVKSHLRIARPILLAVSTNDGLAGSAKNIGALENLKHYFFVPMGQDDAVKKPASIVADYTLLPAAAAAALEHRQLQPILK